MSSERLRGEYDEGAHIISNNVAVLVADMFRIRYDAAVLKVVVNKELIGAKPYFVEADYLWDFHVQLPMSSEFFCFPCSNGMVDIYGEVEIKNIRERMVPLGEIWPSGFLTVDFGWQRYHSENGLPDERISTAIKSGNVNILHFVVLRFVDDIGKQTRGIEYAWCIESRALQSTWTCIKDTKRTVGEKFWAVRLDSPSLMLFHLYTGESIKDGSRLFPTT